MNCLIYNYVVCFSPTFSVFTSRGGEWELGRMLKANLFLIFGLFSIYGSVNQLQNIIIDKVHRLDLNMKTNMGDFFYFLLAKWSVIIRLQSKYRKVLVEFVTDCSTGNINSRTSYLLQLSNLLQLRFNHQWCKFLW